MTASSERQLGSNYRLIRVLGSGAMGEVWEGRDRSDQPIAVKLLLPHLAKSKAIVQRFVGERGVLTGVSHPNLVQVSDLVVEGETLAIVMELVDGPDLRSYLRKSGTLSPAQIVHLGAGVAAGLAAVHQHGIIHRDVKPENVLLQRGAPPTPKLADFGISFLADPDNSNRATAVVGTPYYMAPELIDGASPSVQSDLYALGMMLYELACGVTAFGGGSTTQVLKDHSTRLPGRPAGIPDDLWDIINWLLRKDPALRPHSAQDVSDSLARIGDEVAGVPAAEPLTVPPAGTQLTGVGTAFFGSAAGVSNAGVSQGPGNSGATVFPGASSAGASGSGFSSNPGISSAATTFGSQWTGPAQAGGSYPGGSFPGGSLPGGSFPGGSFPGGSYPGGSMPGVSYPGAPGGSFAPGQVVYQPVVVQQEPTKRTGLVVALVGVLAVALAGLTYLLLSNRQQNTAAPAATTSTSAATAKKAGTTVTQTAAATVTQTQTQTQTHTTVTQTVRATQTVHDTQTVGSTQTVTQSATSTAGTTSTMSNAEAEAQLAQMRLASLPANPDGRWVLQLSSKENGVKDPFQTTRSGSHYFYSPDIVDHFTALSIMAQSKGFRSYILKPTDYGLQRDRLPDAWWIFIGDPGLSSKQAGLDYCKELYPQYSGDELDDYCKPAPFNPVH